MINNLDDVATQTGFGELVGTSQQAIGKHVYAGTLHMGATYRDWLVLYCEKLREQASGRGGDDQNNLTRARIRESEMSADLKELQIKTQAKQVVPVAEIEPLIIAMVTAARTELLSLPDKLTAELNALYGVEIDAALIEEKIHDSLAHLAGNMPDSINGHDGESGESVGAAA